MIKSHALVFTSLFLFLSTPFILSQEFLSENGTEQPKFEETTGTLARPEFTVAGSLSTEQRDVRNLNVGWRFFKGNITGGSERKFDDSKWEIVNVPHGLEVLPEEASGGINYRGAAWYRKHFNVPAELRGKRVVLYFEGVMGKSKFFINGKECGNYFGGYLPIILDVSDYLDYGKSNVIAVFADNSDDASYPPGKPQDSLDFCYFGGIYRDVYLISTNTTYISDANEENIPAGGGVFFWTEAVNIQKKEATVGLRVHIKNSGKKTLEGSDLKLLATLTRGNKNIPIKLESIDEKTENKGKIFKGKANFKIQNDELWAPDSPTLWELNVKVSDKNKVLDAVRIPVGIRTFQLSDKGLILNERPFPQKLIGGNRHQDFAEIGNAVPNNLQWQDAVKLRAAGMRVIRCAHYPMDPAFMNACDRLGLFVIVATPGWQFWNNKAPFEERVYSDIRNMVRRDRNHPCVFMWEPILNESHYPNDFAKRAHEATHEEYPFASCYTACDQQSRGSEHYDVMYSHPPAGDAKWAISANKVRVGKPYFCREFGDNVDSWMAHNSSSRVARGWGEVAQLIQAKHYLKPDFRYTSWDGLFKAPDYHIGGALWHPFDHQRGYHPDTFYGGILDAFRQPKLSYFAFMSQRPAKKMDSNIGSGPVIKIAHAGTPFSPNDVTVYTNCDEVRLIAHSGNPIKKPVIAGTAKKPALPHEPVIFEKAWDFQKSKDITRAQRDKALNIDTIVAEGLIRGKVVCRDIVRPSRRPSAIKLILDSSSSIEADGSSIVPVIANLVDENGTIKRLNNEEIVFEVSGPAVIAGADSRKISWGTAPVLIRMGTTPGKVTVRARLKFEGTQKPNAGLLTFSTVPARGKLLFSEEAPIDKSATLVSRKVGTNTKIDAEKRRAALEKVGADQAAFE